jgi:hypothetical protein
VSPFARPLALLLGLVPVATAGCGSSDPAPAGSSAPSASVAAPPAPAKPRGTPAGDVDELLDGGDVLGGLEARATDPGVRFDPELRRRVTKPAKP